MSDFGKDCTNCRACVDACPFLKEFGTSLKIVEEKPAAVFYGTSCLCCKRQDVLQNNRRRRFF
ncbi:MAG: 4Fe-4S binding protein [Smithella sp.]